MADLDAMKMGGQVSLLAKWMPSCNTSSEATKRQARVLYQALECWSWNTGKCCPVFVHI